jgi:hypothetical protein
MPKNDITSIPAGGQRFNIPILGINAGCKKARENATKNIISDSINKKNANLKALSCVLPC